MDVSEEQQAAAAARGAGGREGRREDGRRPGGGFFFPGFLFCGQLSAEQNQQKEKPPLRAFSSTPPQILKPAALGLAL